MPRNGETTTCEFCRKGNVRNRMEDIAFRQWSDIGRISCRVIVSIGVCDVCGARSGLGIDKVFDEAFQREYDKQRVHRSTYAMRAPERGFSSGDGNVLFANVCIDGRFIIDYCWRVPAIC
jgi:hypothetical protein